jgi:hypothetical protein
LLDVYHDRVPGNALPNFSVIHRHRQKDSHKYRCQEDPKDSSRVFANEKAQQSTAQEDHSAGNPVLVAYYFQLLCAPSKPGDHTLEALQAVCAV